MSSPAWVTLLPDIAMSARPSWRILLRELRCSVAITATIPVTVSKEIGGARIRTARETSLRRDRHIPAAAIATAHASMYSAMTVDALIF